MPFVSLNFFIFVLAVTFSYFVAPKNYRWTILLASSYIYFFLCSKWLILVHIAATAITFITGRVVDGIYEKGNAKLESALAEEGLEATEKREIKKTHNTIMKRSARNVTTIGVVLVLAILIFMKYFNILGDMGAFFGIGVPRISLLLPIGISFYTLQAIAYMVDVYRKDYRADDNIFKFALFMSFFPQIVQGPFARYGHLAHQLYEGHDFDYDRCMKGVQLMLWGCMKKLLIADRIAIPVSAFFDNYSEYHGLMIFVGVALYGLQMYADFSGGIDIARGVSEILGIRLEMNFLQPYFSTSIEDFWRRWHISLGAWMRDYIFYPLSLSKAFGTLGRKSRKILGQFAGKRFPAFLAMFIVYFLVGMWHGPQLKYAVYGVWNGTFISAGILLADTYERIRNKLGINDESWSWKTFQMVRTFIIISIGRIFDGAHNFSDAAGLFKNLFRGWWDWSCLVDGTLVKMGLDTANWIVVFISVIILMYVDVLHERGVKIRDSLARQNIIFRWAILLMAVLAVIVFGIWGPAYDSASFIYEQF